MTNTARKLASGSALRLITMMIGVLISFFMMPFVIKHIGDRWYGLWVLTSSILGFYGLLDMGLSSATQRFIAFHIDDKEKTPLISIFSNSLFLFSLIGLAALFVTALITLVTPLFWNPSPVDLHKFRVVIIIMGSTLAISFPFYVLNGILSANYRYDISSYIQIFKVTTRTALIVAAILNGYGIVGMAVATITVDLTGHLITLATCRKLAPWMSVRWELISRAEFKKLFTYSKYSFAIFLSNKLKSNLDTLIISSMLGLALVTPYNIALQVSRYLSDAINSSISVTMPLFTRKLSQKDYAAIRTGFALITKVTSIFNIAASVPIIVFGPDFVNVWMGPHYNKSFLPLQVLALGVMLSSIQTCSAQMFYAHAKHNILAGLNFAEGLINLTISIILIKKIGIVGAAIGTAVPIIINRLFVFPYFVSKLLDMKVRDYLIIISKPVFYAITLLILVSIVGNFVPPLTNYLTVVTALSLTGLSLFLLLTFSLLNGSERSYLYRQLGLNKLATAKNSGS